MTDGSTTVEGILSYRFTYDMSRVTDENFSAGVSTSWRVPIYFHQFLLALPAIMYLRKRYKCKVKLVMFVTLSLLASFYVRTFFVDLLLWAKLSKNWWKYELVRKYARWKILSCYPMHGTIVTSIKGYNYRLVWAEPKTITTSNILYL